MVNLFNFLVNTGNKVAGVKNALFNKLLPGARGNQPQLDVLQFGDDGALDAGKALHTQNGIKPLTPKERLFGRELEQNIQTFDPKTNEAQMTTIRDYRPGLFNDIAGGYNENRKNAISMSNFGDNTLEGGRKKGFAYRLGEGLGSLARIGESPLGRSLLVGGLVGATGGSGLEALAYGAQTGMLNQQNRNQDRLYRDDLIRSYQQSLENNPEFANLSDAEKQVQLQGVADSINNIRGYMTPQTYSNMIQSNQLRDNAAYRKLYYDNQARQNEMNSKLAQEKFDYQKRQDAIENALRSRELDIQEDRYKNQDKTSQKAANDIASINAIEQQLNQFSSMFKDMPGKLETYTLGNLRNWTGTQSPQQVEFESRKNLLFNKIARDLGGEKGVLSDQDIARVEEAMPLYTDSFAQKQAKMNVIYDLLAIAKNKVMYSAPNASNTNNDDPLGLGL